MVTTGMVYTPYRTLLISEYSTDCLSSVWARALPCTTLLHDTEQGRAFDQLPDAPGTLPLQ